LALVGAGAEDAFRPNPLLLPLADRGGWAANPRRADNGKRGVEEERARVDEGVYELMEEEEEEKRKRGELA
jgi:hypothetical protein